MEINRDLTEPFIYNLSAFLSAGRSITFFMQKEYRETKFKKKFNEWYENKQKEMKKDADFEFFNDMRVATIHEASVIPDQTLELKQPEKIFISDSLLIQQVDKDGNIIAERKINSKKEKKSQPSKKETTFKRSWRFKERPDRAVLELCQEYISKLEKIVVECEDKFNLFD